MYVPVAKSGNNVLLHVLASYFLGVPCFLSFLIEVTTTFVAIAIEGCHSLLSHYI